MELILLQERHPDAAPAVAGLLVDDPEAEEEVDDEDSDDGVDVSVDGVDPDLVSAGDSFFLSPCPFPARESLR